MASFEDASRAFLSWLSHSGAGINPKIQLQDLRAQHAGRGVVAAQKIEEDELLFRVPRSAILSVENSILSKEIPKATFDHLGPWLSLILVMLYEYENKSASNWASYFNVLPSEFNTLMFWERDELDELQASAVRGKIGKEEADKTFKNRLVPVIQEFAEIFFSGDARAKERAEEMKLPHNMLLMHKMGSLIMAYAFDVELANVTKDVDEEGYASEDEDEALPKGMVPLADMLNANADLNNARLFYEEDSLSMKALKSIDAGEEIFNDYGPLPRTDLLRRYGYITENYAQYDVVEIPFDTINQAAPENAVPFYAQKIQYLDDQGIIETGYDISASTSFDVYESISPELIILAETLLLEKDDFERLKRKEKLPKPDRISVKGAQLLREIVLARISQYPTSVAEDVGGALGALKGEASSKQRRYAMARLVRIGEKNILAAAESSLAKLIHELGGSNANAKRETNDSEGGSGKRRRIG